MSNKKKYVKFFVILVSIIAGVYLLGFVKLLLPEILVVVSGESMLPTFQNGEFLKMDKKAFENSEPCRNDIIVYKTSPARSCIKRVIAIPGDKIEIINGQTYLNDELLNEPYLNEMLIKDPGVLSEPIFLGDNEYFCMGDNRNNSKDSREYGPIHKEQIEGKIKQKKSN